MSAIDPKKIAEFLAELSELTRQYQIVIGGCGCCGSPYLSALEPNKRDGSYTTNIVMEDEELEWRA